ncbi:hypothetical protein GDO81_021480 [Engystomops pustulosus]|uniref:Uncharacterized protein n=1 Tax=Engystomops pustulosus TaxID=76066 RepID=A0AAV6YVB5_ENGPU|nr:hypothetical protein GDO81_021480 [Engystomops pustulosus]
MKKKYGPVFTLYFGSKPGVVICGYKAVKEALVNQNDVFGDRGDYPAFSNFLGDHDISFANGDGWKHRRHFALTTLRHFGMGKRSVEDKILEEAQYLIKELKETKGSPVNPLFCLGRAVSNVTCVLLYGKRFDHRDKRLVAITESTFGNLLIMSSKWGAVSITK